jgi:hypothetical protein
MNRKSLPLVVVTAAVIVLGLTLINRAQPQPTTTVKNAVGGGALSVIDSGTAVTVYLRGDATGLAFTDRSSVGFMTSREGKIAAMDDKWLVLDNGVQKSVIPLNAIAMIDTKPNAK